MRQTAKDTSIVRKRKSTFFNDFSISDAENFEPPQQSSTPAKIIRKNLKKNILKNSNNLNISVINNQDKIKKVNKENDNQQYKPLLSVLEENHTFNQVSKLFDSDPEEVSTETANVTVSDTKDSDDNWITLSDVSGNKSFANFLDLSAEIDADIEIRFDKPPRRSYPGRKRNNKSLFEDDDEEKKEEKMKITKKDKNPKHKKKIDPQEEVFIQSLNEHFSDVESFSLTVE